MLKVEDTNCMYNMISTVECREKKKKMYQNFKCLKKNTAKLKNNCLLWVV